MNWTYANHVWPGVSQFWTAFSPWWMSTPFPSIVAGGVTSTMAWWSIRRLLRI